MMIDQLTIFGVGLIGGSLGQCLRQAGYCRRIVGCSRNEANLARAAELGAIDEYSLDAGKAVAEADMVFLAVPMGAMEPVMQSIRGHLSPHCVITDGGSAKASVVAAAERSFGTIPSSFVPGHPIAGREKSGVEAATPELFRDHKVILCPLESTDPGAIERVSSMWTATGAQVEQLEVDQHDLVLAATSHLPHVIAYSLVNALSEMDFVDEIFRFAAGGFRDLSRVASSDPVMWRDICLENQQPILATIEKFQSNLDELKSLIQHGNGEALHHAFEHAKQVRDENVLKFKLRLE